MKRKLILWLARKLLSMEYASKDATLHDAYVQIQQLKKENSKLSIQNTVLKTKIYMVNL